MADKSEDGVAVNIPRARDRYADGVPVAGTSAPSKSTAKKAAKKTGQPAAPEEEK